MLTRNTTHLLSILLLFTAGWASAQTDLGSIIKETRPGMAKPIPVSLSGFSGEIDRVIRFDLYVQGFTFVGPEETPFLISGSNNGNVKGQVVDRVTAETLLSRGYSGASLRRQAHAFTDDVVRAIRLDDGIAQTRIACKVDQGRSTVIAVSDFDGYGASLLNSGDNTLSKSPAWVPGKPVLLYTAYLNDHPEILRHDISTGKRLIIARYGGSNFMPAASPDGSKVAMVLSKGGWVDLYVADADGGNLKQLTRSKEDESSPCWSPDGRWICFATKIGAARVLAKVSPAGGAVERIQVVGVANPSEPDWSPDGKWIAFTSQHKDFDICVVPAAGGAATPLVAGEDPSWAPNSRTLVYTRRSGAGNTLSLLDVPTKQFKDVPRISGSNNSQPAWAR